MREYHFKVIIGVALVAIASLAFWSGSETACYRGGGYSDGIKCIDLEQVGYFIDLNKQGRQRVQLDINNSFCYHNVSVCTGKWEEGKEVVNHWQIEQI